MSWNNLFGSTQNILSSIPKNVVSREYRVGSIQFKHALKVVEKHLNDHDFMVGNQFSGADILAQTFMWAQMVKFPLDMPASLEFLARMKERDGYQRALAI